MRMIDLIDIPFGTRFVGYFGKGYGNQVPVTNAKEIKDVVERHLGLDHLAISISTYKDRQPYLLFLPFDFDTNPSDLKDAWDDAITLYNYVKKAGYGAYLTFSGKKGFHVFIATKPKVYTKKQVRTIQKMFKCILKLQTLDEAIFGDVRRLMRIPWTYNINGGLCEIISKNEGLELDLDTIYANEKPIYGSYPKYNGKKEYHDYPCIESLVRMDKEPRHLIRFTYVIIRLSEGFTVNEILDEIESFDWIDFDEDYTRKQIEHIIGKEYVAPSCETLSDLGYCNVVDCPYSKDMKSRLKDIGII